MGTNPVQRDATSKTVSANVQRLRKEQNLGLRGLATKLAEVGRELGHSAVDQIEKGKRRVDVDDLVALAAALDVSPITLLMPTMNNPAQMVDAPGEDARVSADRWWTWLTATFPLPSYTRPQLRFSIDARPEWDPGPAAHRLPTKETSDGDD